MPQSHKNASLYQAISALVDDFLDKDLDNVLEDPSKTVIKLSDESGIEITIDISKHKNV